MALRSAGLVGWQAPEVLVSSGNFRGGNLVSAFTPVLSRLQTTTVTNSHCQCHRLVTSHAETPPKQQDAELLPFNKGFFVHITITGSLCYLVGMSHALQARFADLRKGSDHKMLLLQ